MNGKVIHRYNLPEVGSLCIVENTLGNLDERYFVSANIDGGGDVSYEISGSLQNTLEKAHDEITERLSLKREKLESEIEKIVGIDNDVFDALIGHNAPKLNDLGEIE